MSQQDTKFVDPSKYELRKVSELTNWDENPRTISRDQFARLKDHIKRLGLYKPLLINQNNIVLGGNMRLNALLELGIDEVMCSVVLTDNKAQMIEYALSDNDQMGETDEQKVAELVTLNPIKTELFAVHTGALKPIQEILDTVSPEEKKTAMLSCPECGHENVAQAFRGNS